MPNASASTIAIAVAIKRVVRATARTADTAAARGCGVRVSVEPSRCGVSRSSDGITVPRSASAPVLLARCLLCLALVARLLLVARARLADDALASRGGVSLGQSGHVAGGDPRHRRHV